MTNISDKIKNNCSNCKCLTNHKIIFSKDIEYDNAPITVKYQTIECMGCENISFRKEVIDYTTGYQDEDGDWIDLVDIHLYPVPFNHSPLNAVYLLPSKIQIVYDETISCLKHSNYLLAGVGFRTLIEAVCLDKSVPGRNLESKINNLSKNRLITDKEADRLHAVRFMGNDSVHEMAVSSKKALYTVLESVDIYSNNIMLDAK